MEGGPDAALAKIDDPRQMPAPGRAANAEFGGKRGSIDNNAKSPGGGKLFVRLALAVRAETRPFGVPVTGACPDGVASLHRDVNFRLRVSNGSSVAVRHQVARPELPHGLRLDDPAAKTIEALALNIDRRGIRDQRKRRAGCRKNCSDMNSHFAPHIGTIS